MIFLKTKTIILIIIALVVVVLVKNKNDNIVIPKESIRIRIIASSNETDDINEKFKDTRSIEEARMIINENLAKLNIVIDDTTDYKYDIKFGKNYFPKKYYKGVLYDEGEYESLVITLGKGTGDNWWCVLFPPLCLLEGNEDTEDVTYQFFVKEIIDKYVS